MSSHVAGSLSLDQMWSMVTWVVAECWKVWLATEAR
jgi:hypothetical protein